MSDESSQMIISLEAAHYYSLKDPPPYRTHPDIFPKIIPSEPTNPRLIQETQLAISLATALQKAGHVVKRELLIDNIEQDLEEKAHPMRHGGDTGRIISLTYGRTTSQIQELGFSPLITTFEANLITSAQITISEVLQVAKGDGNVIISGDGNTLEWFDKKKRPQSLKLFGYNGNPDLPSCEVLDFCYYKEKLKHSDISITILPESYRSQQRKVKKLFEIMGDKPRVIVIYHNEKGEVVSIDHWNEEVTKTFLTGIPLLSRQM